MIWILYSVCIVAITFFAIDAIVLFRTWQSRIFIGRKKEDSWRNLINRKAEKWALNTPTIKLTDNNRLIVIDMLKGNYRRATIQHWQKAGLILGLTNKQVNKFDVKKMLHQTHPKSIPIESDYVIYAYALLNAASEEERIKFQSYFDAVYEMLVKLKNKYTVIPYKSYTGNQMYVDTIGFVCPFLFLYSQVYGVDTASEMAVQQISEFNQFGMYPGTSLPCHTYNLNNSIPTAGLFGWGRGMGWYAIGLIDVWKLMPIEHKDYSKVTSWVLNYAKTILSYQQSDGAWTWNVLVESSRKDSSATVMLTWFLLNTTSITEIKTDSQNAVHKSLEYLKTVTRRDGALDFCQGDTKGIGVYSQTFDILPFAQGYLLRILNKLN